MSYQLSLRGVAKANTPSCAYCGTGIPSDRFGEVPGDCLALLDNGDMEACCSPECKTKLERESNVTK